MGLTYTPLPEGNHIRLLEVCQDPSSNKLVCTFKVVSLDDSEDEYIALSYAWGDQTPVDILSFADGQSISLTLALSTLFDSLQKQQKSFTIWIDAICINQKDVVEKSLQVRLMGKIYSSAEQVLLWLGGSTPQTEAAFQFMESKQTLSWPEDWDKVEDFTGLDSIFAVLEQPYFQRVWVIQEVVLSDNVLMACGNDRIDFDNFRLCVFALWKHFEGWDSYEDDCDAMLGLYCVTRMIFIRDEYQDCGHVRYEILLQAALHCKVTDYRDMVFGFRGISGNDRPIPEPDYTASVEDVYVKTAVGLLCHGGILDSLALTGIGSRDSELPSWVPDLRHHSLSEPFVPCDRGSWNTGGSIKEPTKFTPPNQLHLQVRIFDIVETVCSTFNTYSTIELKTAMAEVLSLKQRLPHDVSQDDWLGTLAESLIFGLNIEDEPAGPEYYEYFKEWTAWLQSSSSEADLTEITSNKYHRTVGMRVGGWKAFMTTKGSFGIGPPEIAVGDVVCVVPGCRFPLVLRKNKSAELIPSYTLFSWCYVHGIMHGEAMASGNALDIVLR